MHQLSLKLVSTSMGYCMLLMLLARSWLAAKRSLAFVQVMVRPWQQAAAAGEFSSVARLLTAAIDPISRAAEGWADSMLPYLEPSMLSYYVSQPERSTSPVAEELYAVSAMLLSISSRNKLDYQVCEQTLLRCLKATVEYLVLGNKIAIRDMQQVHEDDDNNPLVPSASWPYMSADITNQQERSSLKIIVGWQ
ncbi:hypothetical protein VOLCADRAFT_95825 [Volvox carteri f. nagariensis]|uniref:Uncharacterized protein n=1 Tax=Volvox carteri f. nagariensis TaxID=3068 RepID=D8U8H1_VOLCA|nr:uncharacterized protein VOLCADRAFT_95825 [Volvox carteri f. nagariensis]EFJ43978.1 hypothetical protein VOLCADRAFT_95825 [Volvox carteri f. nagariensis]|eukprot:XP_002954990.1 hypothetical protein VOLCADRAFT_95825 [Volvox carteri f. nagariensis]